MLQVTVGCSNNTCTFCGMYREKQFRIRPMEDILEDISMARDHYGDRVRRVFLCDGDAIILPTTRLLEILRALHDAFPALEKVTTYAGPRSTLTKTVEELRALRSAGRFSLVTPRESLIEIRRLVEGLTVDPLHFTSDHISNYLPLKGSLPQDRTNFLSALDGALAGERELRPERARRL